MTLNEQIQPERYYSARQAMKFLPWYRSQMTLTKVLNSEEGQKVYKPIIRQLDKNKRYLIKGSDIIEVIRLKETGELTI